MYFFLKHFLACFLENFFDNLNNPLLHLNLNLKKANLCFSDNFLKKIFLKALLFANPAFLAANIFFLLSILANLNLCNLANLFACLSFLNLCNLALLSFLNFILSTFDNFFKCFLLSILFLCLLIFLSFLNFLKCFLLSSLFCLLNFKIALLFANFAFLAALLATFCCKVNFLGRNLLFKCLNCE